MNIIRNAHSGELKIIDWGLAEFYVPGKKLHPRVATRYYKSPEILLGMEDYHYALDIWSLGCVFAELVLKKIPLFPGSDNVDQLIRIVQHFGTVELLKFIDKHGLKMPEEAEAKIVKYFSPAP